MWGLQMYVLCQDCLKVRSMEESVYWELMSENMLENSCDCGGDECGCCGCQSHAENIVLQSSVDQ